MYKYLFLLVALSMAACQQASDEKAAPALADILAAQPADVRARYPFRHPQETLEFFEIEPGMTVAEGLPGGGWYTKVLAAYLGSDGHVIGISYAMDMWPLFSFGNEEYVQRKSTWTTDFPADADEWRDENSATISAHRFGSVPSETAGTADVVFFARVLHNLANFENAGEGAFLQIALVDAYTILKPGGVFGVVQHHARDEMSDEFANGTHGYLKKDFVIGQVESIGFEFVGDIDINANAKDQPSEDDIVWRLPPSYATSEDDAELRAAVDAIGESNRMTLKFRKPE